MKKEYKKLINNNILPINFNWIEYIELNDDLKHFNEKQAKEHYQNHGYYEKRKYKYVNIPNDFSWIEYIELNDDLKHFNEKQAKEHYQNHGYYEKRQYKIRYIVSNDYDYNDIFKLILSVS